MSDFSLAALLGALQDNLQRAYEHVEDIAELGRQSGDLTVALSLSEFEVEIPVFVSSTEERVFPVEAFKDAETMGAFELAELRLHAPSSVPGLRTALHQQMKLAALASNVEAQVAEVRSAEASPPPAAKARTVAKAPPQALAPRPEVEALSAIKQSRAELRETLPKGPHLVKDLAFQILSGETGTRPYAMVKAKFKAALK